VKILKKTNLSSDLILNVSTETKASLYDYSNRFFGVCIGSVCGYVDGFWIKTTPQLRSFMNTNISDKKRIENERITNEKYNKKFGKTIYDKLKKGDYWIGMTTEMAIISLGTPKNVNNTIGSWGKHEQWVYESLYCYFENGKMTSYQNNQGAN
jgi:hypothetical protein